MEDRILFTPIVNRERELILTSGSDFDDFCSDEEFDTDPSSPIKMMGFRRNNDYINSLVGYEDEVLECVTEEHKQSSPFRKKILLSLNDFHHKLTTSDFDDVFVWFGSKTKLLSDVIKLKQEIRPYIYIDLDAKEHRIYDDVELMAHVDKFLDRTWFPYGDYFSELQNIIKCARNTPAGSSEKIKYTDVHFYTDGVKSLLETMKGENIGKLNGRVSELEGVLLKTVHENALLKQMNSDLERKVKILQRLLKPGVNYDTYDFEKTLSQISLFEAPPSPTSEKDKNKQNRETAPLSPNQGDGIPSVSSNIGTKSSFFLTSNVDQNKIKVRKKLFVYPGQPVEDIQKL